MSPLSDDERHYAATSIELSRSSSDHLSPYTAVAHPGTPSKVAEEDLAQQDPAQPFKSSNSKSRTCGVDLGGSWTWEISSAVLSVIGIALLVVFLISIHGKPYAEWQYTASPNTIISIISVIIKAALLNIVSACLGQLKWRLYKRSNCAPLEYMQAIDEASRGSWGSLKILSRVVSGSKMGALILSGASLTFLAIAIDPFAQQILSFPLRQVQAFNGTVFIQSARNYTTKRVIDDGGIVEDLQERAITRGLSIPDTGLQAQCTLETCSYPGFVSLGICSQCEDVTERTTQECVGMVVPSATGPIVDMNCTYTAPYEYIIPLSLHDLLTGDTMYYGGVNMISLELMSSYTRDLSYDLDQDTYKIFDIETPIASFISATQSVFVNYTTQNTTAPPPKPLFTECVMYWCEKEYAPSNFSATSDPTPISRTQQLRFVMQPEEDDFYEWFKVLYKFVPPSNSTALSNKSSTYHISEHLMLSLVPRLESIFNITGLGYGERGVSSGTSSIQDMIFTNNITDVVKSMSTTLTDAIRAGDVSSRIPGKGFRTETYIHGYRTLEKFSAAFIDELP
ncbi:hypothetical protein N7466_006365 [Penicillium verhagenii]|uniref:uncharacterized protein n=1 Tax=Penicillium verhagenii TaxID=1562060 RepID=UPI002545B153|nr:uncharacterized protein N7466_006365 [Penicillium verhagenii]KAJ5930872.1 hypothetical protein N7466_006365 [Penicillium verhagenii]